MISSSLSKSFRRACYAFNSSALSPPSCSYGSHATNKRVKSSKGMNESRHNECETVNARDWLNHGEGKERPSTRKASTKKHDDHLRHSLNDHEPTSARRSASVRASAARKAPPHPDLYVFREETTPTYFFQDAPENVRKRRSTTMRRVARVIKENFGSEYELQPFGSTRYGVSTSETDIDMVVLDPSRPNGVAPQDNRELPGIYKVRRLATALQRAGFKDVETIPRATVPIVKFKDPVTSLTCDLSINARLGIYNSELIKAYCDLLPALRPLLSSIKAWARMNGFNGPGGARNMRGVPVSFSSYALTVMTIGFLQHRKLLPNLQAHLPPLDSKSFNLNFWITRPKVRCCDCRFFTKPVDWKAPPNLRTVKPESLLGDWFRFWGNEFEYTKQVLRIDQGGIVERDASCSVDEERSEDAASALDSGENLPDAHHVHLLCVMDPFITDKNVVVGVGKKVLKRFFEKCASMVG